MSLSVGGERWRSRGDMGEGGEGDEGVSSAAAGVRGATSHLDA